jgi:tetratricopeptide (TPR) repeat protein
MELRPSFDETPEPRHRSKPRLAAEDGAVIPEEQDAPVVIAAAESDGEDGEDQAAVDAYEMEGPGWHGWIFAGLPLLVVLLGAGREAWSRGLAGVLLGAVMIFFPARRRLPRVALAGLLGAVAAPLLAFLPAGFHGTMPWREALVKDWGLELGSFVTPQPWVTLEAWILFAVSMLWMGWGLSRGFSQAQRRVMLRVLALGGILLCWLSLMDYLKLMPVPWWPRRAEWGAGFGPFANRNHISSLAAITCVFCAASAYDANRRKERGWFIYAAGFLVPCAAIFANSSRAGLLLLFLGMTLWLGFSAMRRGFFKKMAVTASLVMMIAAALFLSRGGVTERFNANQGAEFVSSGARIDFYRDSLQITGSVPWMGLGLGNFDTIFAIATGTHDPVIKQDPRYHAMHPESDLVWLLFEGGLSTVAPSLLLLYWLAFSTGPWFNRKSKGRSHRQDRRTRNTAAIALLLAMVHGLMDVPNHGLGYFAVIALLAGIAVRPRSLPKPAGLPERAGSLLIGAGILAAGIAWLSVSFGQPLLPGTSAAQMLRTHALQLSRSGSASDAIPMLDQAIQMRPLDFQLYFERAETRLLLHGNHDAALQDFTRARYLEPHFAYMCYQEGVDWLSHRPDYAVLGWREFLKRAPQAAPGQYGYYRAMVNHAQPFADLRQQVWKLADKLDLKIEYLGSVSTREDFDLCLKDILARQPDLASLDAVQRMNLFEMWLRLGDVEALMAAIESNKTWERDGGWKLLAEHYAKKSDFRRACEIANIYLPSLIRTTPGTSTDVQALERAFLFNPLDSRLGIDLFQAYKSRNEFDAAIRTLEKVKNTIYPPAYLHQEMAAIFMAKEDFRRAWEHFREAAAQKVN